MPKIAQYQPDQQQTQVVSQPLAQNAPAGAFGGDIARGVADLAQAGVDLKKRVDTTSAEEALVQFEREKNAMFFNPDSGYFNTQGKDAYDKSPDVVKSMETLKMQYGENLSEDARRMFDTVADKHLTNAQLDIQRHAAKGIKAWEVATIEAQVENSVENASLYWNDSAKLGVQRAIGEQSVLDAADMAGIGPEATAERLQTYRSSFSMAAIDAAIASSSAEGKEAMSKYGDQLEGPDKLKMEKLIAKKDQTEKTQVDAAAAITMATRIVDQYDSRQGIIDQVNTVEDPELRKKTMTEAMSQFSRKQQAEKETQNDHYQSAIASVNSGMTPGEIEAQNPEAWLGMTDTQRNNILSGKHMITDQILLSNLRSMPTREKAKINPVEYSDKLRPSDLQSLTNEVNDAKEGRPTNRLRNDKVLDAAERVFGKKTKWTQKSGRMNSKGEKANTFLDEINADIDKFEAEKKSTATPDEVDKIIGDYTRGIVQQRSRFGLDILAADVEIDLSNSPPKDVALLNRVIDDTPNVDMNDLIAAYRYLVDKDMQVTSTNLRAVYTQGRK